MKVIRVVAAGVVTVVVGAFAVRKAADMRAASLVQKAARDLGIELTAERTSYTLVNLANEDGYYGPDIVLRGVTMRVPGAPPSLRAASISIYRARGANSPAGAASLEVEAPNIEVDGTAPELAAMARAFQQHANSARAGAPLSIALRDGTVTARGVTGRDSQLRVRFTYIFHRIGHRIGEPPTRGLRHDEGGGGTTSLDYAEGDFTWSSSDSQPSGPHDFSLNRRIRGDEATGYELELRCDPKFLVRWAEGISPTLSTNESKGCPIAITILHSLGAEQGALVE